VLDTRIQKRLEPDVRSASGMAEGDELLLHAA
jgi:hypothetical protein